MTDSLHIRRASEADAEVICEIYNYYVLNSSATFETDGVSPVEMRRRIREKLERYDWIVGEVGGRIVGYAYYGAFRPRAAYSQTAESAVYLTPETMGKGYGKSLYSALMQSAIGAGIRELIGVVALPNPASLRLHQSLGFREVGILQGVGYKFGSYVDVSIWQRHLVGG